jgi:arabinofuranosyltransferase
MKRWRAASIAAAFVPAALLLWRGFARRWVSDDAFIDFRVVENLVLGRGPVFNLGERVEAYTSPLWVAILWAWRAVAGDCARGSVALGLALSTAGIAAAALGARRLRSEEATLTLPLGALVPVALPAMWDFTTSGLETSLVFAWLGVSFAALAHDAAGESGADRRRFALALFLGLGPLVRPDLALFTLAFGAALLVSVRRRAAHAAALAAPSLGYELFRAAYFACLLPNPALAKEAGSARWAQGLVYARNFEVTYALAFPIGALLACLALEDRGRPSPMKRALLLGVPVAAALHALYVIRVGGDFMHARLLLPSLFALVLPVASVAPPRGRRGALFVLATLLLCIWGVACAKFLRPPGYSEGIADERDYYAELAGRRNPVTLADHGANAVVSEGLLLATAPRCVLIDMDDFPGGGPIRRGTAYPMAAWLPSAVRVVAGRWSLGITAFSAGPDAFIVDRHGLADPIAARLALSARGRPGHEKALRNAWIIARFAAPTAADDGEVLAARRALAAPALSELRHAVEEPLTPGRLLANLLAAPRLTFLRIRTSP